MINLAGRKDCDGIIKSELQRCGITVIEGPRSAGEVATIFTGGLGEYKFERAWYYWVVAGKVPLEVADKLYADPVGRTDIRVGGHCGCPAPREYATSYYHPDGLEFVDRKNEQSLKAAVKETKSESFRKSLQETINSSLFVDDPSVEGIGYVDGYHIDSELGLYLFVQAIKAHGLK